MMCNHKEQQGILKGVARYTRKNCRIAYAYFVPL